MCLVCSHIVGAAISLTQPLLSSKTVEWVTAHCMSSPIISCSSFSTVCSGIRSQSTCNKGIYSASVVESAISLFSIEDHSIGNPEKVMMYSALEITLITSCEFSLVQNPAKSASTN
jgi:hypothetical protein